MVILLLNRKETGSNLLWNPLFIRKVREKRQAFDFSHIDCFMITSEYNMSGDSEIDSLFIPENEN